MPFLLKIKRKNSNKLAGNQKMTKTFKQYEVLKWASLFLEKHHREPRVAEILLQHHLGVDRSQFFAMMRDPVSEHQLDKFETDLLEHANLGVPVQHLTGYEFFYGRQFNVNEHVLIPRPETEELVQQVIHYVREHRAVQKPLTIVDVGTGSGIIAITLALELPDAKVYGLDISEAALNVAAKNADTHGAEVEFLQGDFLTPFISKKKQADIIVSNPPYISKEEAPELSDTVINFDPGVALFAEDEGLAAYKKITAQLPKCLAKEKAALFYEIGHTQGPEVKAIIQHSFPDSQPAIIQDINQKDRIIFSQLPS